MKFHTIREKLGLGLVAIVPAIWIISFIILLINNQGTNVEVVDTGWIRLPYLVIRQTDLVIYGTILGILLLLPSYIKKKKSPPVQS